MSKETETIGMLRGFDFRRHLVSVVGKTPCLYMSEGSCMRCEHVEKTKTNNSDLGLFRFVNHCSCVCFDFVLFVSSVGLLGRMRFAQFSVVWPSIRPESASLRIDSSYKVCSA